MDPSIRELEIGDVAYGGRGVGRDEGLVVFVPGALPGERVRVRLTARHKRFCEADLIDVLTSAPTRQSPDCPLSNADRPPPQRCPGCRYQHVSYTEEVRLKDSQLRSLLIRIGRFENPPVSPPVPAPEPLGYRNKLVLHADQKENNTVLGYVADDNTSILDVPVCPLAAPAIQEALTQYRSVPKALQALPSGTAVTFRHTAHDGVYVRPGGPRPPTCLTESTVLGDLQVPCRSFFQVNPRVADRLVEAVQAALNPEHDETVADLYGGVGLFAIAARKAGCARVLTVDTDHAAVDAARRNAEALGVGEIDCLPMDAEAGLAYLAESSDPMRTAVIVDPPRRGLDAGITQSILDFLPRRLLIVSCAPDTLARDLKQLDSAYALDSVRLFDMFPRTACFECLAVLTRG